MPAAFDFSPNSPLGDALVVLGAAGIVIPLFARYRITPVIGFILVGMLVGPFGLGAMVPDAPWLAYITISDPGGLAPFAEFGIILLLFSVGLELSFARLWSMRKQVFGLGSLELIICAVLIGSGLLLLGNSLSTALALGLALAMSSTALVLKITDTRTPVGKAALSMLLFEDIALVPIIFLLGAMGRGGETQDASDILRTLWLGGLTVVLLMALGRMLLPRLFAQAARTKSPELFLAASLLVVIVAALATAASGLSPIVGALIAGLLIAETEYSGEVEAMTEPFKGLALGVFLITVGMSLDLGQVWEQIGSILIAVIAVLGVKALVTALVLRAMGVRAGTSTETGILMASPSETTLIVLGTAMGVGLIHAEAARFWQAVTALGLTITPLLALLGRRLGKRIDRAKPSPPPVVEGNEPRAIIVGFGRVGRMVADMLRTHEKPFIALDADADLIAQGAADGYPVVFGDAVHGRVLSHLGIDRASAVILTMDEPHSMQRIIRSLRTQYPDLPIIARARDASHAAQLYKAGASHAVPETLESSLQLSEAVLVDLGVPMGFVIASVHEKRDELRAQIMEEGELEVKPRLKSASLREHSAE
ncbi:cation:proton antiporter [Novosphingobium sp. TH158]|uniref:cation:proton antiporter domain-containing protein n=1 Tax=Novosphingobium sp. TH158 TaxID=2067455 RepID=UPI000C799722|nr:cation:proton antiporter [Novosphingobium sp. TH158]PLK24311.1 sodium:proton exchanger [Novosphingobium sp. TH158]